MLHMFGFLDSIKKSMEVMLTTVLTYQRRRDTRKVGRTRTKSLYYSLTAILTMHNLRESWDK
jgi:hypothetical protein